MKSSIGIFYQLTVTDKNGKIVRKTRMRRSKSLCLAFLQMLNAEMGPTTVSVKGTTGVSQDADPALTQLFASNSGEGDVSQGILLGIGTTPVATDDFVMETLIANGAGAGQLTYAAGSFIVAQEVGANVDFQMLRSAQNLSGGTINITEAGIYAYLSTTGTLRALIIHDVFTAVPVTNGQTITATYTLRTTV